MSHGKVLPEIKGMSSLKVDNLAFKTTVNDLRRAFEKHGEIGDVYLPRDRLTRKSRGFAFVRYQDVHDAEVVMKAMNGKCLDGRELRVQMAQHDRPETPAHQKRSRSRSPSKSHSGSKSKSRSPKRRTSFSSEKKVPELENGMIDVKKGKRKGLVQTDEKKKNSRSKPRSRSKSNSSSKSGSLL